MIHQRNNDIYIMTIGVIATITVFAMIFTAIYKTPNPKSKNLYKASINFISSIFDYDEIELCIQILIKNNTGVLLFITDIFIETEDRQFQKINFNLKYLDNTTFPKALYPKETISLICSLKDMKKQLRIANDKSKVYIVLLDYRNEKHKYETEYIIQDIRNTTTWGLDE